MNMKMLQVLLSLPAILASAIALAAASDSTTHHVRRVPAPQEPHVPREAPSFSFDQLFHLQKKFLDEFIYPDNQAQAKSINASILAPNVQGRVDITRTFDGAELNTEYLFGLFANLAATPNAFTLLGIPTAYEITHFAASQNIASASTRFNFTFPILPALTLPIQIETWNTFNAAGQITQYDATFKWWQWTVDYLLQTAASANNMTLPQITAYATQKLAGSICATAMTYCNTTAGVPAEDLYTSEGECETFLTTEVRFGEAYELGRNTLLCRMVHQNMVPFRPAVHCPHIGPTGGGYCDDDKTYAQTVMQDYFSNSPFAYGGNLTG